MARSRSLVATLTLLAFSAGPLGCGSPKTRDHGRTDPLTMVDPGGGRGSAKEFLSSLGASTCKLTAILCLVKEVHFQSSILLFTFIFSPLKSADETHSSSY